jgi:NADH-quinone oxidoreductase subunit C
MLPENVTQNADAAAIAAQFGDVVVEGKNEFQEITLVIDPAMIVQVCKFVRDSRSFDRLSSVTCVDWLPNQPRFEVVYHLQRTKDWFRFRLKSRVDSSIDSVCSVWRSANWYEREIYDMFGVTFTGHPDLKRILMPEDWEGHPLRKDYPVHGHRYSYKND